MNIAAYHDLLARARRLTPSASDAADLVQDVLIASLEAEREDPAWLYGVLKNKAAMTARSAARRRQRESAYAPTEEMERAAPAKANSLLVLSRLPPAARRVALLALHGLAGEEIRWILGISPAAFRQRLTSIRKALGVLPADLRAEALALAYIRDPERTVDLQFGLVRRALRAALIARPGLGTHDPDGHLLVFSVDAHKLADRGN